VINMRWMFYRASSFNQNLCSWSSLVDAEPAFVYNIFFASGCDDTTEPTSPTSNWCQVC
jgi:hypothetical protein